MEIIVNKDGHGVTFGPPRLYLAGPISPDRQQWGLVDWNIYGDGDNGGADLSRDSIAIQIQKWNGFERPFEYNGDSFIYVGPFVGESCDHGCSHRWPHGTIASCSEQFDPINLPSLPSNS